MFGKNWSLFSFVKCSRTQKDRKRRKRKVNPAKGGKPGLNFTNIFTLSFYARRSRKHKMTDDLTVFFTLLGSVSVKAVRKNVDEIRQRREKRSRSRPSLTCRDLSSMWATSKH